MDARATLHDGIARDSIRLLVDAGLHTVAGQRILRDYRSAVDSLNPTLQELMAWRTTLQEYKDAVSDLRA